MSQERRRLRIKVDGKPLEFEVGKEFDNTPNTGLLRLIEYRYLYPERSIKYVEFKGEKLHPSKVDFIKELEELNIVTEPSANMVRKQLELSVLALEGMANAIEQIASDWQERPELAKLMLHNLLDSLDWSVKVVENGSRIIPIVDGIEEEIAKLEDAVFKLDDLMYEGREEEALQVLTGELKQAIERWRDFLGKVVKFIREAPKDTH
ncbi:hypothetical protein [Thermovibrio ammonificans]|jgi:hypothetical protein|uniref:Uncharacterized protein n=1 Tax=Thermovibrio ammonificans (strain DSM 15698 / JCM 12110 / HB-1) TaxID=648996 RepID=E8T5N6_THEA1|nr:hypothetical protein [Thermovibrio ammonificans]ADU96511.1 hypothetical protein Theam_0539 [Thermovibrio ammonificans HB-1]